jgi:hypothetical protein
VHVQESAGPVPSTSEAPGSKNPAGSSTEILQLTKKLTAATAECELLKGQLQVRNTRAVPSGAIPGEPDQASSTETRTVAFSCKEVFGDTTQPLLLQQTTPRDMLGPMIHCVDPAANCLCKRHFHMTGVGQATKIPKFLHWGVLWPIDNPQYQS